MYFAITWNKIYCFNKELKVINKYFPIENVIKRGVSALNYHFGGKNYLLIGDLTFGEPSKLYVLILQIVQIRTNYGTKMRSSRKEVAPYREARYEISQEIISRWSPRAMTGEKIADEELFSLFEAARFAPSSFNEQPWIFCYAKRETKSFS
jgi:hypothetical protein